MISLKKRYDPYQYAKSKRHISWKKYTALFVLFSIILVPMRTYQLLNYINFENGYYTGPDWLMTLFYGLVILFLVLSFILVIYDKRMHRWQYTPPREKSIWVTSLICGVFSLLYAADLSLKWYTKVESIPLGPLIILFSILSSLAFFSLPAYVYRHDYTKNKFDFYLCFPGLLFCAILVSMFLQHTIVATISENALGFIRVSAQTIFFVFFAKLVMGYSGIISGKWMDFAGLIVGVIGLTTTIPVFIAYLFGNTYQSSFILVANPFDFTLILFTSVILYCDLRSGNFKGIR